MRHYFAGSLRAVRAARVFVDKTPDPVEGAGWNRCMHGNDGAGRTRICQALESSPRPQRLYSALRSVRITDMPHTRPHVLFVCALNKWRSPTAARIYANDPRIEVRSAGLSPQSPHRLSLQDLKWADLVLVMESTHTARIREAFRDSPLPPIECLEIHDAPGLMDDTLAKLIRAGTEAHLSAGFGIATNAKPGANP